MTTARTITITHNGVAYNAQPVRITSTMLGFEDHGLFTAMLTCSGDGWGIGIGGHNYGSSSRNPSGYGISQIMEILHVVGVNEWEKFKGEQVLVLFPASDGEYSQRAVGIAHPIEDRVLVFEEHTKTFLNA